MIGAHKRPVVVTLLVLLLALTLPLAGCRLAGQPPQAASGGESKKPGAQSPAVTAWCDPWPPVQLSEDTAQPVLALLEQPRPQIALPDLKGAWVFHLRAGKLEATLFDRGVVVDGQAKYDAGARDLWWAVEAEVCSGAALGVLISAADEVRIVTGDVAGLEVPLSGEARRQVAELAATLGPYSDGEETPSPSPYPDWSLQVAVAARTVDFNWEREQVYAAWRTDTEGSGQATFRDKDRTLRHLLGELATAPDPTTLQGPARLFVYQNVRAQGGPLAEPMEAPPGWTVVMVRCLLSGKPVAGGGGAPTDEEPVPAIFTDPSGKFPPCTVLLYEEGFLLDGCFYRADRMQLQFLTTLNNAGSA